MIRDLFNKAVNVWVYNNKNVLVKGKVIPGESKRSSVFILQEDGRVVEVPYSKPFIFEIRKDG
jgi:hypothetical protein